MTALILSLAITDLVITLDQSNVLTLEADGITAYNPSIEGTLHTEGFGTFLVLDNSFGSDITVNLIEPIFLSGLDASLIALEFQSNPDSFTLFFDSGLPRQVVSYSGQGTSLLDNNVSNVAANRYINPTTKESAYFGSQANEINPGVALVIFEPSPVIIFFVVTLLLVFHLSWRGRK